MELRTLAEAAEDLRCSRQHVYNLVKGGELASLTSGRRRFIPVTAIRQYLETRLAESSAP